MKVAVVDYGVGNLLSVTRAIEHCGATVELIDRPAQVRAAGHLVLPGVGAFADGMRGLTERNLVEPLRDHVRAGKPFLGICLGMQMMFDNSLEFGCHAGLGIIPGRVEPIPADKPAGGQRKIPHIGWNALRLPVGRESWVGTALAGLTPGQDSAYFVHSFTANPATQEFRLADCYYEGTTIAAAVCVEAAIGCQFHPEKSGNVGLRIIERFVSSR